MIVKQQKDLGLQEYSTNYPVKVLLVDDRKENLVSLEELLKKDGENITYLLAGSGEEALKIALKEELALILLDVQMPGMNGYEVAQFLRNNSRTKNIPVIFVTAIDQENTHVEAGFQAGAVDFLFKPLHPYITKAKVSAFVNFYIQRKEVEKINQELENANQYIRRLNQELEDKVKERTKELMKINNDLDSFIYTASHDLKAPINNIEGLMNAFYDCMGEETKKSPEVQELKKLIDESIDRFKNTLLDLTEVARAQSEEASDHTKVSFLEMTGEVISSIKDLIAESGAKIHEDFSDAPEVYFSRKNIRSIIYNLVSNAIKYRSPERTPEVVITTHRSDNYVVLTVKDNGLGIRKEDQWKVFGMFKRLHTHVEGTGIGMAIVKKIVENNGGRIDLESDLGKGSVFTVYLKDQAGGE